MADLAGLRLCLLLAALLSAAPAASNPVDRWARYIDEASRRFAVPETWIRQVMRAESGGRTSLHGRPIVSDAGAMGLMQLMPATWREMRATHGLGAGPHDPRDNVLAGTAYLRLMYDRFGYPGLFAAYNAGPARYTEHLARGRPLPSETRAYVARLVGQGRDHPAAAKSALRTSGLFVALAPPPVSPGAPADTAQPGPLFVKLGTAALSH